MSTPQIILITGANTGLGYQTVLALLSSSKQYTILLGGRSFTKAEAAVISATDEVPSSVSKVAPIQIDIEDDESIRRAFDEVKTKYGRLDGLVNNAGAQFDQEAAGGKMSMREMWNKSYNLNTTSTQILTSKFIPLLLASTNPRLLFITSGTSTLTLEPASLPVNQSPEAGWPKSQFNVAAYRSSKTGLNMLMRDWHRVLKNDGVKVWAVSPGFLATGLGGGVESNKKMGASDPAEGGKFVRSVLEGERDTDVGMVVGREGVQAW